MHQRITDDAYLLILNRYQRDNLLTILKAIMGHPPDGDFRNFENWNRCFNALNTGDWVGEIHNMLEDGPAPRPNLDLEQLYERDRFDREIQKQRQEHKG